MSEDMFSKTVALRKSSVLLDAITEEISRSFDFEFNGTTEFTAPPFELPNERFGIGLIVGPSGSGKSTILAGLGDVKPPVWDSTMSICSHFASAADAAEKFAAVGLNSVPAWLRPRHALSTGEGFRADLAAVLSSGAVVDEFTSVVDRVVAKSCCVALRRHVNKSELEGIVLATCHYDVIEWLEPDWVFDTATSKFFARGSLPVRPKIRIEIRRCNTDLWPMFKSHHYLSGDINKSAKCFVATWNDAIVGFSSALSFPNGNFSNAWREHRTVILPDFQGLGVGVRISDAVAALFVDSGVRYFSKTSHPRMGPYRDASPLWRGTSKNKKSRRDYLGSTKTKEDNHKMRHVDRVCWSHEYVGGKP